VFLKAAWRLIGLLGLVCIVCKPLVADAAGKRRLPLEDLSRVPGLRIELAYAGRENCVGQAIYPPNARALADPRVARALECAAATLEAQGYRLVLLDAYRPPWAVAKLWEIAKRKKLDCRYLSNPSRRGSDHSRGAAVDVTLAWLDGSRAPMPCEFDHFGPEAWIDFDETPPQAAANRGALHAAMEAAGFRAHPDEWWHYVLPAALSNPVLTLDIGAEPKH
jgi:D-alanyl-D-alanine dipeptidase